MDRKIEPEMCSRGFGKAVQVAGSRNDVGRVAGDAETGAPPVHELSRPSGESQS